MFIHEPAVWLFISSSKHRNHKKIQSHRHCLTSQIKTAIHTAVREPAVIKTGHNLARYSHGRMESGKIHFTGSVMVTDVITDQSSGPS